MLIGRNWLEHLVRWQLLLLALLLSGCATQPGVLNYGIPPAYQVNRPMWPSPQDGEVPRYQYAGQLTGEENFHEPKQYSSRTEAAFNWILGLFEFETRPVILQRPQSGMVDGTGRIFVTDTSRQAVYVFDQKAGRLLVWEGGEGYHFVAPSGIVALENGDVYVADAQLHEIFHLNPKGELLGVFGKEQLQRPLGLAFDAVSRHLYVADTYGHDIKVFDLTGRLLRTIGQRGDQPGEFNFPTYIALAKGKLYVADTMNARVQVLDAETGQSQLIIGQQGLRVGDLMRPKGVALDSEGNVYVVESYGDYLLVYNSKGEFLMPIGGTGKSIGKFFLPSGLWIDSKDRVFVADMFNGRVSLFQFLGGGSEGESPTPDRQPSPAVPLSRGVNPTATEKSL